MRRTGPVGCGVAVIVKEGKFVLLIRRKGRHGNGTWSVPGGWVEQGEGPEQAAVRELREEVGLRTEVEHLTFDGWTWTVHKDDNAEDICLWFKIERAFCEGRPSIKEPEKISELDWFSSWLLPDPLFATFEARLKKGAL